MVAGQTSFTPKQRLIIDGAFEISERSLEEVLRPRGEVFVLDAEQAGDEALRRPRRQRALPAPGRCQRQPRRDHRRGAPARPARPGRPSRRRGRRRRSAPSRRRPACSTRCTRCSRPGPSWPWSSTSTDRPPASSPWRTWSRSSSGEIYDETDRDVLSVQHEDDGSMVLPGQFPVHDLVDIGIDDVEDGPYTTVAGAHPRPPRSRVPRSRGSGRAGRVGPGGRRSGPPRDHRGPGHAPRPAGDPVRRRGGA